MSVDLSKCSREELFKLCKERKIKGSSSKTKEQLLSLLKGYGAVPTPTPTEQATPPQQTILQGDACTILPTLASESAQIVICDPPYSIGSDFGVESTHTILNEYIPWCERWVHECLRILKPNGTMFVLGLSEHLALLLSKIPPTIHRRWLVWHYTNKNSPGMNFWQRSHESVLVLWKQEKIFHRDDVREPYSEEFLMGGAIGRERSLTKGRFSSSNEKRTKYSAHPNGALPRDVLKISALSGGAGIHERVNHPSQKPFALCDKLIRSCRQPASEGYVLIPFAGPGTECLVAKRLNLPFVAIEINAEYVQLIHQRLVPPPPPTAENPLTENVLKEIPLTEQIKEPKRKKKTKQSKQTEPPYTEETN